VTEVLRGFLGGIVVFPKKPVSKGPLAAFIMKGTQISPNDVKFIRIGFGRFAGFAWR
jgi:hypothetical protein